MQMGIGFTVQRTAAAWLLSSVMTASPLPCWSGPADVGGQFQVDESGAATYVVPLTIPPGTGGMEPRLSLTYNSQGGNGQLGNGWALGGLSRITRCAQTVAQDGAKGKVNFDANDRFCLDGQRLMVVSGTYGDPNAEYRTERDIFTKVVGYGGVSGDNTYFKAWTKSGLILELGNTTDSRIEAQGKTQARVWTVNKITDSKGNYMTVSYNEDLTNYDYYPTRIDYTGNAAASMATSNSVRFVYETRPDIVTGYQSGSYVTTTQRLITIQAYVGATELKEYRLAYALNAGTSRSQVTSLSECQMPANSCKAPMQLTWSGAAYGIASDTDLGSGWDSWVLASGDFNGDGRLDLIKIYPNDYSGQAYYYLSNGDGTFNVINLGTGWAPYAVRLLTGDFNGDGKIDFLKQSSPNDGGHAVIYYSNGDGTFTTQDLGTDWNYGGIVNYQIIAGDFNGDGKTDLIRQVNLNGGSHAFLYLSGSTQGSYTKYDLGAGWEMDNYVLTTGDFNGDGRTDLIKQYPSWMGGHAFLYFSNGDGTFATPIDLGAGWDYGSYGIVTGDFNGDGIADIFKYAGPASPVPTANAGHGFVYLSKGDGTFAVTDIGTGWDYGFYGVQAVDLDGDGRADLVKQAGTASPVPTGSAGHGFVYLSKGDGTFNATDLGTGWDYGFISLFPGDYDGDGRTDLLRQQSLTRGGHALLNFSTPRSGAIDKVTTFAEGLGASRTVTYKSMTDSTVHTRSTGSAYPVADVQYPRYLVASVASSNGIGSTATTSFQYAGAKADVGTGRGNLGFASVVSTEPSTLVVATTYRQDWPYIGLPSQVKKTAPGAAGPSNQVGLVTNTYSCLNPASGAACVVAAGNRYFPYRSQSVESGWDLNGVAVPTVTTTAAYDNYGNPTSVAVSASDGYSKTTTNTYTNNTTNWYLGLPVKSQVQSVAP